MRPNSLLSHVQPEAVEWQLWQICEPGLVQTWRKNETEANIEIGTNRIYIKNFDCSNTNIVYNDRQFSLVLML